MEWKRVAQLLFLAILCISRIDSKSCDKVSKDHGIVCRCNATYCDTITPLGDLVTRGNGVVYTTSKSGKRLDRSEVKPNNSSSAKIKITVNSTSQFQTIMGFGGAFTDATGINLKTIPEEMSNQIIEQYFSEDGLGYVFGRVPMASCDFSTRVYSYDDDDLDFDLKNFSLATEDLEYKIPFIKKAKSYVAGNKLQLFASPWSSPGWMKTTGKMLGPGELLGDPNGKYYATWAQYFVKFFEAYHANGVEFWGLTPQNEPTDGLIPLMPFQSLYFDASMQRNFIKKLLGPALASNAITKNLKLMINDDQRLNLPHWADVVIGDSAAAQYVHGIAVHWYEDAIDSASVLTETHQRHPDYFILGTEACAGYFPATGPELGKWSRAEQYANDVIKDLGHWVSGWVDWNMALNLQGGPNLVENYVDSPIIINSTAQEYYKQPMWHVMGQFSRFVRPGSIRVEIEIEEKSSDVEGVAFLNTDGSKTVVVLNKSVLFAHKVSIADVASPDIIYEIELEANSMITLIYK